MVDAFIKVQSVLKANQLEHNYSIGGKSAVQGYESGINHLLGLIFIKQFQQQFQKIQGTKVSI